MSKRDAKLKIQLEPDQRTLVAQRLVALRNARGLTQLEVAQKALGFTVSHAAVSRLERGALEGIAVDTLQKLADFYQVTFSALVLVGPEGKPGADAPEAEESDEPLQVEDGFGQRITLVRLSERLTKAQFAEKLGYEAPNQPLIGQWEREELRPRPDTMLNIATKFGVSAAWLCTGKRAKHRGPTFAIRLAAFQKLYDLSNRDVAELAGLEALTGRSFVARCVRRRVKPGPDVLHSLAAAFDVPVSWLSPPEEGSKVSKDGPAFTMEPMPSHTSGDVFDGLADTSKRFLRELVELLKTQVISEKEVRVVRARFMKELAQSMRFPTRDSVIQ